MFQFRLATLMVIVFASAILIYINTVPSSIATESGFHGESVTEVMVITAHYGWPLPGFFWLRDNQIDAPFRGISTDGYWRVNPYIFSVNILTALALLGLIGFASENYFRRPPEDRLQLHYVTKMVVVLVVCVVLFFNWINYLSWLSLENEALHGVLTNSFIRSCLILSLPSILIPGSVTEWIVRLKKAT